MKRADGRAWNELRPVQIETGFQSFAEGLAKAGGGTTKKELNRKRPVAAGLSGE